ncbi:hypothetical protein RFI_00727 [Reticulomyxa filosa]|uniref:Uncharacterized protein n=1 Tax=Reticulomyxa filosa TaxID=46433 RepID=X6PCU3_RETFI|nr:hypothetical protein RFI_00727 [Reticulomyxa filosa]|eukprot:ETO36335.1 hypothetical protein RFI_00727 [Reticulomyxa filosa]
MTSLLLIAFQKCSFPKKKTTVCLKNFVNFWIEYSIFFFPRILYYVKFAGHEGALLDELVDRPWSVRFRGQFEAEKKRGNMLVSRQMKLLIEKSKEKDKNENSELEAFVQVFESVRLEIKTECARGLHLLVNKNEMSEKDKVSEEKCNRLQIVNSKKKNIVYINIYNLCGFKIFLKKKETQIGKQEQLQESNIDMEFVPWTDNLELPSEYITKEMKQMDANVSCYSFFF